MRKQEIVVTVCIEKDGHGFYAYAPALKGLHIGGSTMDEVTKNVQDGIIIYLESLVENGEPFPKGSHLNIQNYNDLPTKERPSTGEIPLTKEVSLLWLSQMMPEDRSEISRQEKLFVH